MPHRRDRLGVLTRRVVAISLTASVLVAPLALTEARADYRTPDPAAIPGWFPQGLAQPVKDQGGKVEPGKWQLNDWRTTEIGVEAGGRRVVLTVYTNGLFEEKWPYTRILDTVLARVCDIPAPTPPQEGIDKRGTGAQLLDRAYKSKSLIKGKDLGGNGGTTFEKQASETRNGCRITMKAEGARWHTITTTVESAGK